MPRKLAFDILLLVERGGYASDLLFARSAGLDSRDAALVSETEPGHPAGLRARWDGQFGAEGSTAMRRASLERPETYTRGGRVQDIGAQSIVPLLGLEPGQTFLDLCAAPGNKTAQALEAGVL